MGDRTAFTRTVFTGDRKSWRGHARAALFGVMVLGLLLAASQAAADTILYNTGVDASGTALGLFSVDPHYTLIAAPGDFLGPVHVGYGSWQPDSSTSAWISPNTNNPQN